MPPTQAADSRKLCRHLLRHLDDPSTLSTNELVAPVFRSESSTGKITRRNSRRTMASIRGLVRAAANDLLAREGGPSAADAMRQHEILMRCDLLGEPHKRVASELGLSMRQFYRERHTMIERLTDLLVDRLGSYGVEPACTIDVATLELSRARALQYGGYSDWAFVVLRSIMESSDDPSTVVAAGCQLVSILIEHNKFERSLAELDALEKYVTERQHSIPGELQVQRIALERRNALWCSGHEMTARKLDERARDRLMFLSRTGYRPAQEFCANAFTYAGRRNFMSGEYGAARENLENARDLLALREQAPVDLQINLLVQYGVLLSTTREERATTSVTFLDATTLAVRHGLSELAILAAVGLSIDDQMRGDDTLALTRVREVVPLARSVASPLNMGHLCLRVAELEVRAGNPIEAMSFVKETEQNVMPGTYVWTYKELLSAYASLALKDFPSAKNSAQYAASAAMKQGNGRTEGSALCALAESYIGLNARSAAIEAIEAALVKLENAGYPLVLAAAYRTAAKLTGRAKYERAAEEFAQLIRPA